MNQLQAVAMNEGYRWKKKLFSEQGTSTAREARVGSLGQSASARVVGAAGPLNPTIEELTAAVEQEAKKRPEVLRLMTHPGVGPTYGAGLCVDHWNSGPVSPRQADRQLRGDDSVRGLQCRQAAVGAHQQARQFVVALFAGGSSASSRTVQPGLATSVHAPDDASAQKHCQSGDGPKTGCSVVLDVAEWLAVFAVVRVRFVRGTARNRTWREVERRPHDWASRSLQREFEVVIMVEVLIEEMVGSD